MRIRFFALAALAILLGACTQDEAGFLPEGAEGTPIVFTATGLNPAATAIAGTRAPVDGNWTGVQSVAVLMDGTVKAYDVTPSTADPTSATLTSTDPYYWTNHNDITVTAWWPYTAGETTPPAVKVKANQSTQKDFEGSDLIVADGQTVTYGSPTLRFTHRTARVTIVLTDYTEGLASVQLTGLSTEGDNPDIIVPYDKGSNTYTALVAPQSVAAGTAFITCTFTNGTLFKIITALGIYDTEMALIITMVTQTLPTAVFMLKSYFDTIPDEIEEAAMMDGLNRLQIIFRITVPLAMSGLISVFVYCFMVAWNDYLFASIFLSSASNFTLPVGLNALFSTPDYIWGRMMAASLVTALPVVIMYALSERFIKSGLTAGGVTH